MNACNLYNFRIRGVQNHLKHFIHLDYFEGVKEEPVGYVEALFSVRSDVTELLDKGVGFFLLYKMYNYTVVEVVNLHAY